MPMFDFRCATCGLTFEKIVRSDATVTCAQCGSANVEKCVSAPQAPGKTAGIIASGRRAAAAEGHFSNYSRSERAKIRR